MESKTQNQNKVLAPTFDQLLIYRTNIKSKKKLKVLQPFLDEHPLILSWTIDRDDVDKVLRLETKEGIGNEEVKYLVRACGFVCEDL